MPTNSSLAGYLAQTFPPHVSDKLDSTFVLDQSVLTAGNSLDDDDLFDFFHDYIAGLTGLDGSLVLPRWQSEAPVIPPSGTPNWCGFGMTAYKADTFVAEVQKGTGGMEMHRHEELTLMVSFYGKNPVYYARVLRDGMQLSQNLEVLSQNSMGLVESGEVTLIPSLLKELWLKRADLPITIRRQVVRGFPVLNLLGTSATLYNERYSETVTATVPPV